MKDTPNSLFCGFYDYKFHNVLAGSFMVTKNPYDVLYTLLGSCVSACMRCTQTGIGGLNHFLLPLKDKTQVLQTEQGLRYGDVAMEHLVNSILHHGGHRHSLEVKLFGGGNMYPTHSQKSVGDSNIRFVLDFIQTENIKLVAQDVGGNQARKIYFHPFSGKVKLQKLNKNNEQDINHYDIDYKHTITQKIDSSGTAKLCDKRMKE